MINAAMEMEGLITFLCFVMLTLAVLSYIIKHFTHLKLCLATTTNNFKWVKTDVQLNPLKPELTIVIFIHYKPRIAVAILDL